MLAFAAVGVPLGSGAIENAIRRVINLRLKGNSISWYEANAEGMLLLRLPGAEQPLGRHLCLHQCQPGQRPPPGRDLPLP